MDKQTWITPLMLASALGKPQIVKTLLQRAQQEKIDILNMVDGQHNTVLAYAISHKKCFSLLIKHWKKRINFYLKHPIIDYRLCLLERTQAMFTLRNHDDYSLLDLALLYSSDRNIFFQITKIFKKIELSPAQHIHIENKDLLQNQLWLSMIYKFIFCLGMLGAVTHLDWVLR